MMGAGKTYSGNLLAMKYKNRFIDLDDVIEDSIGMVIPDIFKKYGEPYFRKKEAELLRTISLEQDIIIGCGGGAPCFEDNILYMKYHGKVIFLDTPLDVIYSRLILDRENRPLLKYTSENELFFKLDQLLTQRKVYYQLAHLCISSFEELDLVS